ncbi:MAG TPA: hypothetical protein VKY65_13100 [Alphaproteobacteria bacterium]|nr:hypothetical protein [Alphaproteobacteria bacterium]
MREPSITREAFAALTREAGLALTPEQADEIYPLYAHLEAMRAQVRGERPRAPALEPALIFAPTTPQAAR